MLKYINLRSKIPSIENPFTIASIEQDTDAQKS
jgi:hypothetical protein